MASRRRLDPGGPGSGALAKRNKRGTPLYSHEDIREQYCINDKELHALEATRKKPLFGCLTARVAQPSPCRRKSLLSACLRTRVPSEDNVYGKPASSLSLSPSHRKQPIDYEDESYFKRRPKTICYTDPKKLATLDDTLAARVNSRPRSDSENLRYDNKLATTDQNDTARRPTHLTLASGEYHSAEVLQDSSDRLAVTVERTSYTQPNTPELSHASKVRSSPQHFLDDRGQQKHVSFQQKPKSQPPAAVTAGVEKSTSPVQKLGSPKVSTNSVGTKIEERLLEASKSPEFQERKTIESVVAPPAATKALLQGKAPNITNKKKKVKLKRLHRSEPYRDRISTSEDSDQDNKDLGYISNTSSSLRDKDFIKEIAELLFSGSKMERKNESSPEITVGRLPEASGWSPGIKRRSPKGQGRQHRVTMTSPGEPKWLPETLTKSPCEEYGWSPENVRLPIQSRCRNTISEIPTGFSGMENFPLARNFQFSELDQSIHCQQETTEENQATDTLSEEDDASYSGYQEDDEDTDEVEEIIEEESPHNKTITHEGSSEFEPENYEFEESECKSYIKYNKGYLTISDNYLEGKPLQRRNTFSSSHYKCKSQSSSIDRSNTFSAIHSPLLRDSFSAESILSHSKIYQSTASLVLSRPQSRNLRHEVKPLKKNSPFVVKRKVLVEEGIQNRRPINDAQCSFYENQENYSPNVSKEEDSSFSSPGTLWLISNKYAKENDQPGDKYCYKCQLPTYGRKMLDSSFRDKQSVDPQYSSYINKPLYNTPETLTMNMQRTSKENTSKEPSVQSKEIRQSSSTKKSLSSNKKDDSLKALRDKKSTDKKMQKKHTIKNPESKESSSTDLENPIHKNKSKYSKISTKIPSPESIPEREITPLSKSRVSFTQPVKEKRSGSSVKDTKAQLKPRKPVFLTKVPTSSSVGSSTSLRKKKKTPKVENATQTSFENYNSDEDMVPYFASTSRESKFISKKPSNVKKSNGTHKKDISPYETHEHERKIKFAKNEIYESFFDRIQTTYKKMQGETEGDEHSDKNYAKSVHKSFFPKAKTLKHFFSDVKEDGFSLKSFSFSNLSKLYGSIHGINEESPKASEKSLRASKESLSIIHKSTKERARSQTPKVSSNIKIKDPDTSKRKEKSGSKSAPTSRSTSLKRMQSLNKSTMSTQTSLSETELIDAGQCEFCSKNEVCASDDAVDDSAMYVNIPFALRYLNYNSTEILNKELSSIEKPKKKKKKQTEVKTRKLNLAKKDTIQIKDSKSLTTEDQCIDGTTTTQFQYSQELIKKKRTPDQNLKSKSEQIVEHKMATPVRTSSIRIPRLLGPDPHISSTSGDPKKPLIYSASTTRNVSTANEFESRRAKFLMEPHSTLQFSPSGLHSPDDKMSPSQSDSFENKRSVRKKTFPIREPKTRVYRSSSFSDTDTNNRIKKYELKDRKSYKGDTNLLPLTKSGAEVSTKKKFGVEVSSPRTTHLKSDEDSCSAELYVPVVNLSHRGRETGNHTERVLNEIIRNVNDEKRRKENYECINSSDQSVSSTEKTTDSIKKNFNFIEKRIDNFSEEAEKSSLTDDGPASVNSKKKSETFVFDKKIIDILQQYVNASSLARKEKLQDNCIEESKFERSDGEICNIPTSSCSEEHNSETDTKYTIPFQNEFCETVLLSPEEINSNENDILIESSKTVDILRLIRHETIEDISFEIEELSPNGSPECKMETESIHEENYSIHSDELSCDVITTPPEMNETNDTLVQLLDDDNINEDNFDIAEAQTDYHSDENTDYGFLDFGAEDNEQEKVNLENDSDPQSYDESCHSQILVRKPEESFKPICNCSHYSEIDDESYSSSDEDISEASSRSISSRGLEARKNFQSTQQPTAIKCSKKKILISSLDCNEGVEESEEGETTHSRDNKSPLTRQDAVENISSEIEMQEEHSLLSDDANEKIKEGISKTLIGYSNQSSKRNAFKQKAPMDDIYPSTKPIDIFNTAEVFKKLASIEQDQHEPSPEPEQFNLNEQKSEPQNIIVSNLGGEVEKGLILDNTGTFRGFSKKIRSLVLLKQKPAPENSNGSNPNKLPPEIVSTIDPNELSLEAGITLSLSETLRTIESKTGINEQLDENISMEKTVSETKCDQSEPDTEQTDNLQETEENKKRFRGAKISLGAIPKQLKPCEQAKMRNLFHDKYYSDRYFYSNQSRRRWDNEGHYGLDYGNHERRSKERRNFTFAPGQVGHEGPNDYSSHYDDQYNQQNWVDEEVEINYEAKEPSKRKRRRRTKSKSKRRQLKSTDKVGNCKKDDDLQDNEESRNETSPNFTEDVPSVNETVSQSHSLNENYLSWAAEVEETIESDQWENYSVHNLPVKEIGNQEPDNVTREFDEASSQSKQINQAYEVREDKEISHSAKAALED